MLGVCGNDGNCDGMGGCELSPAGTICSGPTCAAGTHQILEKQCDGMGGCTLNNNSDCMPLMCDGAAGCLLSCTADTDCVTGTTCQAGSCM
jgi:hypothetical protein